MGDHTPPKRRGSRPKVKVSQLLFAFTAAVGFLLVNVVDPYSGATAAPNFNVATSRFGDHAIQTIAAVNSTGATVTRDGVTVKAPPPPPQRIAAPAHGGGGAPAAGVPDPGTAQAIALQMLQARGWGTDQYNCLVSLWNRESGWNVYSFNKSSGAYGIPQALPGSKMASAGANWQTNPATQITWGLGYITGRYGTPCGAWGHSQSTGWY
ncbi:MAG: hypothetical protein QOH55_2123 [Microbacteriaceae bacterium]|jgi:hypothetical protein|nr:hypothetical protein [Microbacteriaceae bacterium]